MKNLIASLALFALCLSAHGQAVRNLDGFATNISVETRFTFGRTATNFSFRPLIGNGVTIWVGGVAQGTWLPTGFTLGFPFEVQGANIINSGGVFHGNGGGLSNLVASTFPPGPTYVFNGKVTMTSNVTFRVIDFFTNSHPSSTTISLTNSWGAFATNNNTTFDNLAGIDAGGTNAQSVMLTITNSSAAAKTIIMHARFQNMNPTSDGNTLYLTNVGQLLVFHYPGFGTNYYWRSR